MMLDATVGDFLAFDSAILAFQFQIIFRPRRKLILEVTFKLDLIIALILV
jgi:hypothetical protein